jgi:hypothetical protein
MEPPRQYVIQCPCAIGEPQGTGPLVLRREGHLPVMGGEVVKAGLGDLVRTGRGGVIAARKRETLPRVIREALEMRAAVELGEGVLVLVRLALAQDAKPCRAVVVIDKRDVLLQCFHLRKFTTAQTAAIAPAT